MQCLVTLFLHFRVLDSPNPNQFPLSKTLQETQTRRSLRLKKYAAVRGGVPGGGGDSSVCSSPHVHFLLGSSHSPTSGRNIAAERTRQDLGRHQSGTCVWDSPEKHCLCLLHATHGRQHQVGWSCFLFHLLIYVNLLFFFWLNWLLRIVDLAVSNMLNLSCMRMH